MRTALSLVACLVLSACGADSDDRDADDAVTDRDRNAGTRFTLAAVPATHSGLDQPTRSGTAAQRHIVEVKSTGVGLLDHDGDGRLDIVLTAGSTLERHVKGEPGHGTRLWRNLGGLRFEDVTEAAGLPRTGWACAPVCADWDGDGDTDLFVTQYGPNLLLRNDGGRFTDVTAASGLAGDSWSTSAVFHDLDGDGDLDLYVCNYLHFDAAAPPVHGAEGWHCRWKDFDVMCGPKGFEPAPDRVWRNDGEGRFTDVTEAWGFSAVPPAFGLAVIAGNLDADPDPEIYVANDSMLNHWFDRGPGGWTEGAYFQGVACGEDGSPQAGMGLDTADLNADGVLDIVCTNFSGEVNDLYVSAEGGVHIESSATFGTAVGSLRVLGWGTGLRDLDLDGHLDLYVANGHVYPQAARPGTNTDYRQYDNLWLGTAAGPFAPVDRAAHTGLAIKRCSRGAAFGDLDDDGDTDVVVVNLNDVPTLLECRVDRALAGVHFLGVRLVGSGANTDGIGARVTVVQPSGRRRLLEVRRQSSFQASSDPRLLFGLGEESSIASVEVVWPDGRRETFDAEADRYVILRHGQGKTP